MQSSNPIPSGAGNLPQEPQRLDAGDGPRRGDPLHARDADQVHRGATRAGAGRARDRGADPAGAEDGTCEHSGSVSSYIDTLLHVEFLYPRFCSK